MTITILSKTLFISCLACYIFGALSFWAVLFFVRVKPEGYLPDMDDVEAVSIKIRKIAE